MTILEQIDATRLQGEKDFAAGKNFAECPIEGKRPEDIELRWHWQLGWLRAQLRKQDADKKAKT